MQNETGRLLENETKKCPTCAETIKLEALKCRFCGETFDPNEVKREVDQRLAILQLVTNDGKQKECPQCHKADAYWAHIEDGSMGYWCPNCESSLLRILETSCGRKLSIPPEQPLGIVCPHCHTKGHVHTHQVYLKKGISGGKVMGALFTGGLSLLATGLSRKEQATEAQCSKCGSVWHF